MTSVSLVQVNFQTGPHHLNSYYLPYSVGALWSFVEQNKLIKDNFIVSNIIFRREPIEELIKKHENTDIVLLSLYIWNKNYCFKLAEKLKEAYPDITILMGGPELPWRDDAFFEKYPFIDSIVVGEGELALEHILLQYHNGEEIDKVNKFERMKELDLPSPYLNGMFDNLVNEHTDIEWVPTIETDRGCPYSCTFCDWGSATASKMYKFYFERIDAELDWIAKNKLPYLSLTSSNFGIFKDRDLKIAEKIVKHNKETGCPNGLSVSYAKNSNDTVVQIVKLFTDAKIQTGVTLSLQTTSDHVLENIKRKNMKINSITDVTDLANKNHLPVLTELILGMPGEDSKSWRNTLEQVIQNNILNLDVYFLQLLINSPMYVKQIADYNLQTFEAFDFFYGVHTGDFLEDRKLGIAESIEVIQSTNTFNKEQLIDESIFTWFVLGFNMYGISNILSKYLFDTSNHKYMDFYQSLYNSLLENDKYFPIWVKQIKEGIYRWQETGYMDADIGGLSIQGWQYFHSLMPIIQNNDLVEHYINFVADHFSKEIDIKVLNDYKNLSKNQIKQFNRYITNEKILELESGAFGKTVKIVDRFNQFPKNITEHLEFLFFGRRRSWHMNIILDK
jgi:radical SAM superfamily enzyme YgiQ (UPF0313 family)